MTTKTSNLIVRLTDGVTGPAARAAAGLQRLLGMAGRSAGAGAFGGMARGAQQTERSVASLTTRLFALAAAGYAVRAALGAITGPTGNFETTLVDIAQKAELSGVQMEALGGRIRLLAREVGRGANETAKGMDVLLAQGLKLPQAVSIMPAIMRTATAYRAEVDEVAKAGMSVMTSLKVEAVSMQRAFDAMAQAGNEGAFELKDMARYFPSLAAIGQTRGMTGIAGVAQLSSALQVIRMNAGTSEEAATRLSDVLIKMTSDETIKKFKKLGVDIEGMLKKGKAEAEKAGKPFDFIQTSVEAIMKATKGNPDAIKKIFADKEALQGAGALVQHFADFLRISQASRNASGVVNRDFGTRMKSYEATVASFNGAVEELRIALGSRFMPTLTEFIRSLTGLLDSLDKRVTIIDKVRAAIEGLMSGLGFDGSSLMSGLKALRDFMFGDAATLEADALALHKTFMSFRDAGETVAAFARSIGELVASLGALIGLDGATSLAWLGTLAGYGATFAAAAVGIKVFAGALMFLGRALMFVTGASLAMKVLGGLAGLAGGVASGAAVGKGAAVAGAAGGAAAAGGGLARFIGMARSLGTIGAAVAALTLAKSVIDKVNEIRDSSTKGGINSAPQSKSEGEAKLADQRAELAEIETRLATMRAKSRDQGQFDIINQTAIQRAQELRNSIENLEADLKRLDQTTVAPKADGSSLQRLLDLAQRAKAAITSLGQGGGGSAPAAIYSPTSARGPQAGGRGTQQANVTVNPTFNISGVANAKEVAEMAVARVRDSVQSALRDSHRDVGFGYG
jgi:TP901 family phage tail tape measure protein